MERREVEVWVQAYVDAWRTAGTEALRDLFCDDAAYSCSPWSEPVTGLEAIAEFWEAERDGPDEHFELTREVVAVDGALAVVRLTVDYAPGNRWRDLWVLHFAEDGRCRAFEEWPFAPGQPDGH